MDSQANSCWGSCSIILSTFTVTIWSAASSFHGHPRSGRKYSFGVSRALNLLRIGAKSRVQTVSRLTHQAIMQSSIVQFSLMLCLAKINKKKIYGIGRQRNGLTKTSTEQKKKKKKGKPEPTDPRCYLKMVSISIKQHSYFVHLFPRCYSLLLRLFILFPTMDFIYVQLMTLVASAHLMRPNSQRQTNKQREYCIYIKHLNRNNNRHNYLFARPSGLCRAVIAGSRSTIGRIRDSMKI